MRDDPQGLVPADDGQARHLVVGTPLPNLMLVSTRGGKVNLATRKGRAVLYVYPWTGRPAYDAPPGWDEIAGAHGSTPETAGFRDLYQGFQDLGVEILGLSTQSPEHQSELGARLGLPFAILSDEGFRFRGVLKLPTFMTGGSAYLRRLTLIVHDGMVQHVFYPVHQPEKHAAEVLDWLRSSAASA